MKYTADCPNCGEEFEINGEMHARAGVICPKCRTEFRPEKIHKVSPSAEEIKLEQQQAIKLQKDRAIAEIVSNADWCFWFGLIFSCLALIFSIAGFTHEMSIGWFSSAGLSFSFSMLLFLFSHLLNIRASLERLNLK